MWTKEEIDERYTIGQGIMVELFKKTDAELKEFLKTFWPGNNNYLLGDNSTVKREIVNEKPAEINIIFYDRIEINYFGIRFYPKRGIHKDLVNFDKHFKL